MLLSCRLTGIALGFGLDRDFLAVAKTIEEARFLIEAGFEYVTERDGVKIYWKRE